MHRPVRLAAPQVLPVSLDEVKKYLRIDFADDDDMLTDLIQSAVDHYEGWAGILGVCLVEQTWRQSFDRFSHCLALPLGPVIDVVAVKTRSLTGVDVIVDSASYALETDAAGRSSLRFVTGFEPPSNAAERSAISVEYKAGWPVVENKPTVPSDIRTAIIMRVQAGYEQSANDASNNLKLIENALISKWRRSLV